VKGVRRLEAVAGSDVGGTIDDLCIDVAKMETGTREQLQIAAVSPMIDVLESRTFTSEQECYGECSAVSKLVDPHFRQTLGTTQRREENGR
jgi:hypothetical protein